MGKILVIASVVISLATVGLGFVNKTNADTTKKDLAETQAAKQAADQKTAAAEKELKAKSDQLVTATAEKEQAVAEASQAKSDLAKANTDLAAANSKATTAETQLAQVTAERDDAVKKLAEVSGSGQPAQVDNNQITELTTRIQEQETLIAKLQSEIADKSETVKTYAKKEEDRIKKQLAKGTEGRVLAVNPAWNFVVLNLGDKQNVSNNTELLVKRGTRYLGKVRITSVEPSTSIADIVANSMPQGATITPGDTVIFQGDEE
jgi:flagellar biosynthesis chaperone FliJ